MCVVVHDRSCMCVWFTIDRSIDVFHLNEWVSEWVSEWVNFSFSADVRSTAWCMHGFTVESRSEQFVMEINKRSVDQAPINVKLPPVAPSSHHSTTDRPAGMWACIHVWSYTWWALNESERVYGKQYDWPQSTPGRIESVHYSQPTQLTTTTRTHTRRQSNNNSALTQQQASPITKRAMCDRSPTTHTYNDDMTAWWRSFWPPFFILNTLRTCAHSTIHRSCIFARVDQCLFVSFFISSGTKHFIHAY